MNTFGIVGATGAVGVEALQVLEKRNLPLKKLRLFSSARSAGKIMKYKGEDVVVEELKEDSFAGVDMAIFSAGGDVSRKFATIAAAAGCIVIDNSSAFRMDPTVPLVIPEINADALKGHKNIVANPNCTTIVALMALYPLHKAFGVKRVFASSYQAVSGTGAQAVMELEREVGQVVRGESVTIEVYPKQIAFNVLPHVDVFLENGYTKEEMKMENEGKKIMSHPSFKASVTCVRVPVYRAHAVAVSAEFEKPITPDAARAVLSKALGIKVVDDPSKNVYPTPLEVSGKDDCEVGRIRIDCAFDNGLSFWVVGDQLLKGAALNAIQIAERLLA
ncbi:aspartate-semialdehyde dehydrogenase [Candidatus Kaiserbacteria bacterium]|nr:aspartate-semialdehyde dehydrogenase [Candidatus Kaiserbacteria bacterium]